MRATKTEPAFRLVKRMGAVRREELAPHGNSLVGRTGLVYTGELVSVIEELPIQCVRFSSYRLREGTERHVNEGVPVRVTTGTKTVADSHQNRKKIGLNPALEALRQRLRERRCGNAEMMKRAAGCGISTIVAPYADARASN